MRTLFRSLLKAPLFSAAMVVTLGIGLGANAALFAIVNHILLRPLPYDEPARLVMAGETRGALRNRPGPSSAPAFLAWQREARSVERLAAYRPWGFVVTGGGDPERLIGARVSADLFPLLGIRPIVGKTFSAEDDVFGGPRVAVVSEALWQRRLGSDRDLARHTLVLNGVSHAVVGVLPHGFSLPAADVWVPLALEPFALAQPGTRALTVVGRLRNGASPAQASAELDAISQRLAARSRSGDTGWGAGAVPLQDQLVGAVRPTLLVAWGAVGLVLLIACANTASLMLARAAVRRREIAIRQALGAPRSRIAARVLGEGLVLALAGGVLGLALAVVLLRVVIALAPPDLPRLDGVGIDIPVAIFTAALSAATALVFGWLPAVRASQTGLSDELRAGTRGTTGAAGHTTLRHLAVSCQVGLTLVVLVGAGLLIRSFARASSIDAGFQSERVLTMTVSLPDARYGDPGRRSAFFSELLRRSAALPGVESAGFVSHVPLAGAPLTVDVTVDGRTGSGARETLLANCSVLAGDWFGTMRIPLIRGRMFSDRDGPGAPPVVIVNARLAARLWPGGDAVGHRLIVGAATGADQRPREIIGIAGDVRASLEAGPPDQVYLPHAQNPWPTLTMAIRTSGEPGRWTDPLRSTVLSIDPDQAVYNVRPFDSIVARALAARRFQAFIIVVFAAAALVLAAAGVYSVVAYGVRQRRQEIGVRLALGARGLDVVALAVGDSLRWAGWGLLCGGALAFVAARSLAGILYEIPPTDAAAFIGAAAVTSFVIVMGSAIAARAALTVDPLTALRD